MMNLSDVPIFNLEGKEIQKIELSEVFQTPFRPDIIKRAVLASRRNRQIPYGVDPRAGKKTSAESWGTGRGAARVPRVKGSRTHSGGRAALIPFAVGGRRTHPPEGNQNFTERYIEAWKFHGAELSLLSKIELPGGTSWSLREGDCDNDEISDILTSGALIHVLGWT